ncbi:hypothetical protein [Solidesulfovibrio sp.]|uniref:hypothetical protein n=1 Tax=Solidesulfovibrio sp. TaxID=2910990 RepID=UPI0026017E55|nr:hypothetical protein [Solidesulfovibrio sp.]
MTTRCRCGFFLAACLLCLATARDAAAHRVNVFAYVEGDTVHVECSYSRSDRVRFGDIDVQNAADGKSYLTGKTDEKGDFSFSVPPAARAAKADLRILLRAGEGHRNDWTVKYDEYAMAAPAARATLADAAPVAAQATPKAAPTTATQATPVAVPSVAPAAAASMDTAAFKALLETTVEGAVEKKIAPIRKMLLDDKEKGPGAAEIFGGIGWLVGIAGIAAYAKSRKSGRGA